MQSESCHCPSARSESSAVPFERVRTEEPGPTRLLNLLAGLESPVSGVTLSFAAGAVISDLVTANDQVGLAATLSTLEQGAGGFPYGLIVFWSSSHAIVVRPPFPSPESERTQGWETRPLLGMLGRPRELAVVLLRRGGYSIGVFDGDLLVDSRTGSRFVKNRHRKGGQSQRRFDRIREKQLDQLFEKTCESAQEKIEPRLARLDAVFLGGDRHTVGAFLKCCPFLSTIGNKRQSRFLNTPEPRQDTLRFAYDMIWRSTWIELRPTIAAS